jgi:hypothetical protein
LDIGVDLGGFFIVFVVALGGFNSVIIEALGWFLFGCSVRSLSNDRRSQNSHLSPRQEKTKPKTLSYLYMHVKLVVITFKQPPWVCHRP